MAAACCTCLGMPPPCMCYIFVYFTICDTRLHKSKAASIYSAVCETQDIDRMSLVITGTLVLFMTVCVFGKGKPATECLPMDMFPSMKLKLKAMRFDILYSLLSDLPKCMGTL